MNWDEIKELTSEAAAKGFSVDYYMLQSEKALDEGDKMALMFVAGYLAARNDRLESMTGRRMT